MSRVLLFGPPFFGYVDAVRAEFERRGFDVDYYNDRPSQSGWSRAVVRVRPSLLKRQIRAHFETMHAETAQRRYDRIVVINGKTMAPDDLARLRADHPGTPVVVYFWDSLRLYPHLIDLVPYADRAYSFDTDDCATYPQLSLLPLFFTREFGVIGDHPAPAPEHDLVSVCTAHPNRYVTAKVLFPRLRAAGLRVFSYLYLHPLQYVWNVARVPAFRRARPTDFSFTPLPPEEYRRLVEHSAAVFDINHSAQSGLTIRTLETLGARRKLVTANTAMLQYRAYDPSRVLVVHPDELDTLDAARIQDFLAVPQVPWPDDEYRRHSIEGWVDELITGRCHRNVEVFLR